MELTIHIQGKDYKCAIQAAWELFLLTRRVAFSNATCQWEVGGGEISLFIHLLHFMIMPLTSIEIRHRELRRQIKEQLLGFVENEEVRIK